jgi:hypothetical protein
MHAQMAEPASVKDLVALISRHLVDNPDSVSVGEVSSGQTMVLELRVAKVDVGKVIGREGRTAHALRTIIQAVTAKRRQRAVLEILE